MKIDIKPGTYVVAVSGGVDSMVLLDLLAKLPKLKLIVAHFDHGIRPDSDEDKLLVQQVAAGYGLPFVYDAGHLGAGVSEADARAARYKFLHKVKQAAGAVAIITAHHQDDLLETAVINMLRGTNRRGLSSLKSQPELLRPLLGFTKANLLDYAKTHQLVWHEDSMNQDDTYLRNYVRHSVLSKFSAAQKSELLKHVDKLSQLNKDIDSLLDDQLKDTWALDRQWFIMLTHNVARDVLATWLKNHGAKDIDKRQLERLVQAAKTFAAGKSADVDNRYVLSVGVDELALVGRER